jgi:hypothetical protein
LRGIEGARVKAIYKLRAQEFGIPWEGRKYDRANPDATDLTNQAINHAATAVQAAAAIAVKSLAAVPQLGFIHEDSGQAFVLDVADLFRDDITLSIAFAAVKAAGVSDEPLDRLVRREASRVFRKRQVIPSMIDRIKLVCDWEKRMALAVIVTRDVADRFRGFLASVMLEVAPGVFISPRMNKGVRERTWSVLADWHGRERRGECRDGVAGSGGDRGVGRDRRDAGYAAWGRVRVGLVFCSLTIRMGLAVFRLESWG